MSASVANDRIGLGIGAAGAGASASAPAGACSARGALAGLCEASLVRRAREGSVEAFGELVERYEGRVMAMLRFRLRPDVEAEDVAQDSFVRAWTRLEQFDETRPLGPWLMTIASRTAVAHNRTARKHLRLAEGAAERDAGGADWASPGEGLDAESSARESTAIWETARGCLSEEAATALWLRYGESMSMREIGNALGKGEITTRVMISRARKRLRLHLESDGERIGEMGSRNDG